MARLTLNEELESVFGIRKASYVGYKSFRRDREAFYTRSNGEIVKIVDMSDSHLINAIRVRERDLRVRGSWGNTWEQLVAEAIYRNLAYGNIIESEWDSEENNG